MQSNLMTIKSHLCPQISYITRKHRDNVKDVVDLQYFAVLNPWRADIPPPRLPAKCSAFDSNTRHPYAPSLPIDAWTPPVRAQIFNLSRVFLPTGSSSGHPFAD